MFAGHLGADSGVVLVDAHDVEVEEVEGVGDAGGASRRWGLRVCVVPGRGCVQCLVRGRGGSWSVPCRGNAEEAAAVGLAAADAVGDLLAEEVGVGDGGGTVEAGAGVVDALWAARHGCAGGVEGVGVEGEGFEADGVGLADPPFVGVGAGEGDDGGEVVEGAWWHRVCAWGRRRSGSGWSGRV